MAGLRPAPSSTCAARPCLGPAGGEPPHPASAGVVDWLRTRFTFQISVDVATLEQGRPVAGAALAGGVTIVEMATPLLKNQGVSNVVPAFRQAVSRGAPAGRHEDHGWRRLRGARVYAGGGNIVDFLALAGADTAKAICAVRDESKRAGSDLPRLAFADIMVPHQGPAAQAGDVALRMLDAGVDAVGIHLQSDARRADPRLIESDYLGDMARAVFERVGKTAPVQVVGGLSIAQAKNLPARGCALRHQRQPRLPDTLARYDLPPAEIKQHVAAFIAEVSSA